MAGSRAASPCCIRSRFVRPISSTKSKSISLISAVFPFTICCESPASLQILYCSMLRNSLITSNGYPSRWRIAASSIVKPFDIAPFSATALDYASTDCSRNRTLLETFTACKCRSLYSFVKILSLDTCNDTRRKSPNFTGRQCHDCSRFCRCRKNHTYSRCADTSRYN